MSLARNLTVRILAAFLWLAALTSCDTISHQISKVTGAEAAKDKEIAALRADYQQKLDAKGKEKDAAVAEVGRTRDATDQLAANAFYAQDLVFKSIPSVLRTDLLIHNLGEEGWTALNHRTPTYESMKAINERIAKDLDATKTSLADLEREHQAALVDSAKASGAAKAAADRLADAQKSITDLKTTYATTLADKETERAALADQKADLETARADDAAAIQALKTKISIGCAVFALLCAAGAIYLPVGKGGLAALGAVAGIAAAAIWVITGAMVLYAVLACVLCLIGWAVYQHNTSNKTVTALTGYLHDKGHLADTELQAWMTKYVKHPDGSVTTVPDKAVAATVTAALTNANKL